MELVNDQKADGTTFTMSTFGNTLVQWTEILQYKQGTSAQKIREHLKIHRRLEEKVLWSDETKMSSLALT